MKNLIIGIIASGLGLFILGEMIYRRVAQNSPEMSGLIGGVILLIIGINRIWMWKKRR